jgi:hypothetical protein
MNHIQFACCPDTGSARRTVTGADRGVLRMRTMLDHSKVTVKSVFLPCSGVPGIKHYEAVRREIIRLLCAERDRQGLTNYALAQRSGLSESMLSLVERGLRNPTLELLLRLADGIGANLPAIIERATRTAGRNERVKAATPKGRSRS